MTYSTASRDGCTRTPFIASRSVDVLDALHRASRALANALTIDAIVKSLTDVTLEEFGAELGTLLRRDLHDDTVLTPLGGWGYEDRSRIPRFQRFAIDASRPLRDAFVSGRPVLIGSLQEALDRWPDAESPGVTPDHESWAVLPFEIGGVTAGLLSLADPFALLFYTDGLVERRGTPITERIEELAVAFGNTAGQRPDAAAAAVLRAMWPDGTSSDDVAILCIQDAARDQKTG